MFRRKRFGELIAMQLDVFAIDHADRLQALRDALEQYRASDRYAAEERYGDYADEIDWAAGELAEMRDAYAATIDPDLVDQYEREFSKAVHRVYPPIAVILDTL
jgi:HAMP domain-containing protein